jgi:hypothetical protein
MYTEYSILQNQESENACPQKSESFAAPTPRFFRTALRRAVASQVPSWCPSAAPKMRSSCRWNCGTAPAMRGCSRWGRFSAKVGDLT